MATWLQYLKAKRIYKKRIFTEVCRIDDHVRGGDKVEILHCRFGHLKVKNIDTYYNMVENMNLGKTSHPTSTLICEACMEGKPHAAKLGNDVERQSTKPLEFLHSGFCGPMKTMFMGMKKIFC